MRHLAPRGLALSLLLVALPAGALPAGAQPTVTIDFGAYASPATTEHPASLGEPLRAGGLDFLVPHEFVAGARNVLGTWGTDPADPGHVNRPSNLGAATALFATHPGISEEIDIFRTGSDLVLGQLLPFGLKSVDVAHLYSSEYASFTYVPFDLEFFAFGSDGSFFSQLFTVNAPPVVAGVQTPLLQTLTFDERFESVVNVFWYQSTFVDTRHQFTNVVAVVAVVPEPGTSVLMLTGLGGLGLVARRRRRAAA